MALAIWRNFEDEAEEELAPSPLPAAREGATTSSVNRLQGTGVCLVGNRVFDPLVRDLSLLFREEPAELAEDLEVFRLQYALLAVGLHHVVVDVLERFFFTDEITIRALLRDTFIEVI